jgi:hypothetical protein
MRKRSFGESLIGYLDDRDNAEAYLLDLVRGKDLGTFSLSIERSEAGWAIALECFDDASRAEGAGPTFAAAMKAVTEAPPEEIKPRPVLRVVEGGRR